MATCWIIPLCLALLYTGALSATTTPPYRTTTRRPTVTIPYSTTQRQTTRYATTRYIPSTTTKPTSATVSSVKTPITTTTTTTTAAPTTPGPTDMCSNGQTRVWYWISEYLPASTTSAIAVVTNVDTVRKCQESCTVGAHVNKCKSFTFSPVDRKCLLYDFRNDNTGVTFMVATPTSYYFQWQCRNYAIPPCASTEHLPMFRYRNNNYLDSGLDKQEDKVVSSLEKCEEACIHGTMTTGEVTTECRSVDYREATSARSNSCNLNYWTLRSDSDLSTSNELAFYERMCFNDPGICSARLMANRVWYAFTDKTYNTPEPTGDRVITDVTTYQGCRNLCLFRHDRTCKSVKYASVTKTCYLYTGNTDTYVLQDLPNNDIYEFRCPERKITQCSTNMQLIWAHYRGRIIQGHRDVTVANVQSVMECKRTCLEYDQWVCKSIEYNTKTKMCSLSGMNRYQSALAQGVTGNEEAVLYYEWLCKTESCGTNQYKVHFERKNHQLMYRDDIVLTEVSTLHECIQKCSDLTEFRCRSFEYSDKTLICRLAEVTEDEAEEGELVPITKEEYRYVEWRCRSYDISLCPAEGGSAPYWSEYKSSRLHGGYVKTITGVHSQSNCEEICMENSNCNSVEHRGNLNSCEVNNVDLEMEYLEQSSLSDTYLEWNCAKPQYNPCSDSEEVYWEAFIGRRYNIVSPLTIVHHDVSTLIACEHLCLKAKQENKINCESIQLHRLNQTCHLFSGTAKWNQLTQDSAEYGYFQRHCRPAVFHRCQAGTEFLPNSTTAGFALHSDSHGIAYASTSHDQCVALCKLYTYFECQSVDYSATAQKCVLHAVGEADGFALQTAPTYSHSQMECMVPPSTSTSIGGGEVITPGLRLTMFALSLCWLQSK